MCLVVGMCPSRLAVDWQSVDLGVSGTGGLLSQPSSLPPADRQGQGLILPVFLSSWQPFLWETSPGQPCTPWHAPSPINIASPFSNLLPWGLLLRVWTDHPTFLRLDLTSGSLCRREQTLRFLHSVIYCLLQCSFAWIKFVPLVLKQTKLNPKCPTPVSFPSCYCWKFELHCVKLFTFYRRLFSHSFLKVKNVLCAHKKADFERRSCERDLMTSQIVWKPVLVK